MNETCQICGKTVDSTHTFDNFWDDPKECCLDCLRAEKLRSRARKAAGRARREERRRWERKNSSVSNNDCTPTEFEMLWDRHCEDALGAAKSIAETTESLEDEYAWKCAHRFVARFCAKE